MNGKVKVGLQLVGLGLWTNNEKKADGEVKERPGSVQNLLNVLTEPASAYPLEFSFATTFQPYENVDVTAAAYDNARSLIAGLSRRYGASLDLTVTVYVGFHESGDVKKLTGLIKKQAMSFGAFLKSNLDLDGSSVQVRDVPGVKFVVSPSLEDKFTTRTVTKPGKGSQVTSEFASALLYLAGQLTANSGALGGDAAA